MQGLDQTTLDVRLPCGQDSCASDPSEPCPTGGCYSTPVFDEVLRYVCVKDANANSYQTIGYINLSPGATAPKWSKPGPGQAGWSSQISSAVACGRIYQCSFSYDEATDTKFCKARECGLEILWTLAKRSNPRCVVIEELE
jgi:hypothetical protein